MASIYNYAYDILLKWASFSDQVIILSLTLSFASLAIACVRLNLSEKFGTGSNLVIHLFRIIPKLFSMAVLCLPTIIIWSLFAAYHGAYVFIAIGMHMLVNYLALQTFVFGWNSKEKEFDAMLCGEARETRKSKSEEIFRKAILISWIAPVIDWHLGATQVKIKSRRKLAANSFFCVSSSIHYVSIICAFVFLCVMNSLDLNNFTENKSPLTHCFENTSDHWRAQQTNLIRWCETNEKPTDFFFNQLTIWISIFVALSLVATLIRAINIGFSNVWVVTCLGLTRPEILEKLSSYFQGIINNNLEEQPSSKHGCIAMAQAWLSRYSHPITRGSLNHQNLVDGSTCLHFAFRKCIFEDCLEMIKGGADPHQKNRDGVSVASLIENPSLDSYSTKRETWLGEPFFESKKIKSGFCGIIYLGDSDGRVIWSIQFDDKDELVIANCLVREAVEMVERSDEIKWDKVLSRELGALKSYYSQKLKEKELFNELKINVKEKKIRGNVVKPPFTFFAVPPLHYYINNRNLKKYDFLCLIGANPRAKNVDGLTPLEDGLKNFKGNLGAEEQLKLVYDAATEGEILKKSGHKNIQKAAAAFYSFVWGILVRGGVQYLENIQNPDKTSDQVRFVLSNFPPKGCKGKLPKEFAQPLFLQAVKLQGEQHPQLGHSPHGEHQDEQLQPAQPESEECQTEQLSKHGEYAAKLEEGQRPGDMMKVTYYLDLGCNIRTTKDVNGNTPLHIAAQHQSMDCIKELLVAIYLF